MISYIYLNLFFNKIIKDCFLIYNGRICCSYNVYFYMYDLNL